MLVPESVDVQRHADKQARRNASWRPIIEAHEARKRILGELEKQMADTATEYVGQKARVILTCSQNYDWDDARDQMDESAHMSFERMMAEHGCTPTHLNLLWVKPIDDVEPELLGDLANTTVRDIDIWMYEATAS